MLNAHGWIIVRSSREKYQYATDIDRLDDETDKLDSQIWDELEEYLRSVTGPSSLLKVQFTRHLNNISGHMSLLVSRNHTAPELYRLLDWITENAKGSYGIIYLQDDEGKYPNEFRIIKVNKGQYTEHSDQLLSPIYPVVEYEE